MKTNLSNLQDTKHFADFVARKLMPGDVISLEGNLGAGKTTLLQFIASALGISKQTTSPTFILFRVLPLVKSKRGIKWLVHGDAYRVQRQEELTEAGLNDYLQDPHTVTIIEWGNNVPNILPKRTKQILIKKDASDVRSATYPDAWGMLS